MRRVFLDLGSHRGETARLFRQRFPNADQYEIHCFEPTPGHAPMFADLSVHLHSKAVWTHDGLIDFYLGRDGSECSSAIREKTTGRLDREHPIQVPCVRLSRWLFDEIQEGDYVVAKMNIEGAEYRVLPDLVSTGAIGKISELYVEWHLGKVGVSQAKQDALIAVLKSAGVTPISIWGLDWL